MKAAVYYGAADIRIEDVDPPSRPGRAEVLIEPAYVGICGTDLHEYAEGPIVIPTSPHPLTGAQLPQILGHEFSATVRDIGPEVTNVVPGDRVAVMPSYSCGVCLQCLSGQAQVCRRFASLGLSARWGGMAAQAIALESQLTVLPKSVSLLQAALAEPAKVAAYAVDRGKVLPGGSVLIVGGGPIGALCALYAHAAGIAIILVSEANPERRALLRQLNIGTVIDPTTDDLQTAVELATHGEGVDAAIEAAGSNGALVAAMDAIRPRGVVVQAALHTRAVTYDPMVMSLKDGSIESTWCWTTYDWRRIVDLIATGRFPIETVVTGTIAMDSVIDGFTALLSPTSPHLKLLVEVTR